MREIKFRYVFKRGNEIRFYFINISLCEFSSQMSDDIKAFKYLGFEIISRDQFSGKCDKNKKEIYENDLVHDHYAHDGVILWGGHWNEAGFGKETDFPLYPNTAPVTWDRLTPELAAHLEIIGNIYENKEIAP